MMSFKKIMAGISAVCCVASINISSLAYSEPDFVTLYVSDEGNDKNAGTYEAPFATIERARDEIRNIKRTSGLPKDGVCVYIRGGDYSVMETIEFTEEDSGTENSPVTYRAYPGEEVKLFGGIKIEPSDFKVVNDQSVIDKLYDPGIKGKLLEIDLTKYGLVEIPGVKWLGAFQDNAKNEGRVTDPSMELFVDGEAQTIARWPNEDYYSFSASGDVIQSITETERKSGNYKNLIIKFKNDRAKKWNNSKTVLFHGYWDNDWADYTLKLNSYTDGVLEFDGYNIYTPGSTRRFYAYNLLEELDAKGEFYTDTEEKKLYYYPVDNYRNKDIYLSLIKDPMFKVSASYLDFKDLNLGFTRGQVFNITGDYNTVSYCTIHSTADMAINVYGRFNGIVSNYIYDVNGGIALCGGDIENLVHGENYAENNYVKDFARLSLTYCYGIGPRSIGERVSNNTITGSTHLGLEFFGPEHVIEYNDFFNILTEADDAGAIYTGKRKFWYGNVIRYNYFHDMGSNSDGAEGIIGIYLDDGFDAAHVYGNIFKDFKGVAIQATGTDGVYENNLSVNIGGFVRGVDWSSRRDDSSVRPALLEGGEGHFAVTNSVWLEKYPQIKEKLSMENMLLPENNKMVDNIAINAGNHTLPAAFYEPANGNEIEDVIPGKMKDIIVSEEGIKTNNSSATYSAAENFPVLDSSLTGVYAKKFAKEFEGRIVLGIKKGGALNNNEVKAIDGENNKIMPFIEDNRTMVPIRFIAESLGAEVEWNEEEQKVTIKGETNVELVIGENSITVNGEKKETDAAAKIIGGRTFVPLRSVSEGLNKAVHWDERGLIIISDNDNTFDLSEYPEEYAGRLLDEAMRQIDLR